eukprot:6212323-Pleurochrysis_carterae.AAC.3
MDASCASQAGRFPWCGEASRCQCQGNEREKECVPHCSRNFGNSSGCGDCLNNDVYRILGEGSMNVPHELCKEAQDCATKRKICATKRKICATKRKGQLTAKGKIYPLFVTPPVNFGRRGYATRREVSSI